MHVARRFERLIDVHRRPDGSQWTGQRLDEATGGVVPRSYVTNFCKGRIENPGYEKLAAIAKAMGFPPELWFEEDLGGVGGPWAGPEPHGIPDRLEHLFGAVKNPTTGKSYANAEVARMSASKLTEGDVEGIRTGKIADPTVGQVVALAAAFGVPPSYLLDRGKGPPIIDEEALGALADETASAILRESAIAPEGEGDRPRDRAAVRRPARRT